LVVFVGAFGAWWYFTDIRVEKRNQAAPTTLTRSNPTVIKAVLDHGGENLEALATTEKTAIQALGANTIYVYLEYEYVDGTFALAAPFRGRSATTAEEQYRELIKKIKEAGFAVHLAIAFGGGQNKPFAVPIEQLLNDAEAADIKWASIAEELKVESYAPSSEIDYQIFREYYGQDWTDQAKHDEAAQKSNEYHDRVLPKLRQVFKGKLIFQAGLYSQKLCSKGYDIFGTGLNSVSREVSNFAELATQVFGYAENNAQCSGSEWMLTEFWVPYLENDGTPDGGAAMKTPNGVNYAEIQDGLYQIGTDAYLNWSGELKPVGFGFTSWQQATARVKDTAAAEVIRSFFAKI